MCGRFVMLTRDEVERVVHAVERGEWLQPLDGAIERNQAFPGSDIAAFGVPNDDCPDNGNALAIGSFRWGFPVEWSKKPVFNTRIESALSGRGMWRELMESEAGGRCIVPALTFFEPHATETVRSPKTGRQIKRAYEFAQPDGMPLLLAGLTDGAHCSIVTTEPNRWVAPIHNRMPLVLQFEEIGQWLKGTTAELESLADRSGCSLDAHPEFEDLSAEPSQLSLF